MTPTETCALLSSSERKSLDEIVSPKAAELAREFIVSGMVTEEDLTILANTVCNLNPMNTIEIGLASASTAITIMASKKSAGIHLAFDPGQTKDYHSNGVHRIGAAGLSDRFELIEKPSYVGLPVELATGRRYDFAFIDSNHMFDHTLLEWFYIDKMLEVGGVIGFDDVIWPMVHAVVNFIESNCAYKFMKPNDRTWLGVKLAEDNRYWFDYKPFLIPWGNHYQGMIDRVRKDSGM